MWRIPPGVLTYNEPEADDLWSIVENSIFNNCKFANGTANWAKVDYGIGSTTEFTISGASSITTTRSGTIGETTAFTGGGKSLKIDYTQPSTNRNQGVKQRIAIPAAYSTATGRKMDAEVAFCVASGANFPKNANVNLELWYDTGSEPAYGAPTTRMVRKSLFFVPGTDGVDALDFQSFGGGWNFLRTFYVDVPDSATHVSIHFRHNFQNLGFRTPIYLDHLCATMYTPDETAKLQTGPSILTNLHSTSGQSWSERNLQRVTNAGQDWWESDRDATVARHYINYEGTPLAAGSTLPSVPRIVGRNFLGYVQSVIPVPSYYQKQIEDGATVDASWNVIFTGSTADSSNIISNWNFAIYALNHAGSILGTLGNVTPGVTTSGNFSIPISATGLTLPSGTTDIMIRVTNAVGTQSFFIEENKVSLTVS